jgi:hypothetical protein
MKALLANILRFYVLLFFSFPIYGSTFNYYVLVLSTTQKY